LQLVFFDTHSQNRSSGRADYPPATAPQSVIGTTIALMADYSVPTLRGVDARTAANLVERLLLRIWSKARERAA